jgi:hypothetical protein
LPARAETGKKRAEIIFVSSTEPPGELAFAPGGSFIQAASFLGLVDCGDRLRRTNQTRALEDLNRQDGERAYCA